MPKDKSLPSHLNSLPPVMEILDGYKWIFVNEGWTLIPSVNIDKFYSLEPSPLMDQVEDPIDDELLDWGDDKDYPGDEFAEEDQFLEEENFTSLENVHYSTDMNDVHPTDPIPISSNNDSAIENKDPEVERLEEIALDLPYSDMPLLDPSSHTNAQRQIRRSDRPKKPAGRWNEEAGFVPHHPRST